MESSTSSENFTVSAVTCAVRSRGVPMEPMENVPGPITCALMVMACLSEVEGDGHAPRGQRSAGEDEGVLGVDRAVDRDLRKSQELVHQPGQGGQFVGLPG